MAEISRTSHQIILGDGSRCGYDHPILATGARNVVPPARLWFIAAANLPRSREFAHGFRPQFFLRNSACALL
ncbi:hypothetical protein [Aminobacter sp. DSM 101952]|uniref:hypothetical protein n=1 Tax=Aminobacter sp. DSM 101952 TaxID=2735891 RepID=UPI0012E3C2A4|nr:hypothetical protein [Aminobacter sp. DSM 101952]